MSIATEAIEKLAEKIGADVYIDIARWHLYLAEARLHTRLATEFYPLLLAAPIQAPAVKQVLTQILVSVGGGQRELPLADLIPATAQATLLDILQTYQADL